MIEVKFYDKAADDLLKFAVTLQDKMANGLFASINKGTPLNYQGDTGNVASPSWKQHAGSCRKKREPLILQLSQYVSIPPKAKSESTRMQGKKPMGCCLWQMFSLWGKSTAR